MKKKNTSEIMVIYKLICAIVLCLVFVGTTVVANNECNYGVCKPYSNCQTAQLARLSGTPISLCNSRGGKQLVCCHDTISERIPLFSNVMYLMNLFNNVTTVKPLPITAGYSTNTNTAGNVPNSVGTNTNRYGSYPDGTSVPEKPSTKSNIAGNAPNPVGTNTNSYGNYPGTSIPQKPSTNTNTTNNGPDLVGTNGNSYGNYPGSNIPPQPPNTNINTAGNAPNSADTNTNSYGNYPGGIIFPQKPSTNTNTASNVPNPGNTNTNNYGHYPTGTNTSYYGTSPTGTNLPQRPSFSSGFINWPTTSNNSTTTTARPVATTPPPRPTTTEFVPPIYDYITKETESDMDSCDDLGPKLTTSKTGRPAWDTGYSTNTNTAGNVPNPMGTNTNDYGNYPGGTSIPQKPSTNTNTAGNELNPGNTNTNNYGHYPTGTNTSYYGTSPTGTNLPQRPSFSSGFINWPTTSNNSTTTTARPVATTPPPRPTTTEFVPPIYDYITKETESDMDSCDDLGPKLTTSKTGRPAWDKCLEYQQLVYPCQATMTLQWNMVRANNCDHALFSKEEIARPNEFPHMVVLGYRTTPLESLRWGCTGTLISERFTLSSAYCLRKKNKNDQIYAVVGLQQRIVGNTAEYQEYRIESISYYISYYGTPSNGYNKDMRYHDIALLKAASDIRLSQWVVPACLDVFDDNEFSAVATRWRARSWDNSNVMQKTFLHQISQQEYQYKFPYGYRVANQIGYGRYGNSYDNCKYDNEGPLTVENHLVHCMYTLKGVFSSTSTPTCGRLASGSYTNIANYTSWIEQKVWPRMV